MSTSNAGQEEGPPYPAYARDTNLFVRLSTDAKRIFWTLDGPLETSVSIMEKPRTPQSLEPYYTDAGTWHVVSQSPLTQPKISSITVHVTELERWEEDWLDAHRDHSDPDENRDGVQYGELPDYNPEEDEDGPEHLLMCCGIQRPRNKNVSIAVKPAASNGFVTVDDYLSTVHPWLLSLRKEMNGAIDLWENGTPASDRELMVNYDDPAGLSLYEKEEWIQILKIPPNPLIANWNSGNVA